MNLTQREIESQYCIEDFMTPLSEALHIKINNASTKAILECVENGKMGFSLVLGENNMLRGLVSSADIRKALLAKIDNHQAIGPEDLINKTPISIAGTATVNQLLKKIKSCPFPIMYLPVTNEEGNAIGIVNFVHLIKGEI